MGSEWNATTLGEVLSAGGGTIQTGPFGSQLHASDYVSNGIPVIMPVNIADNRVSTANIAMISESDANRLSRHIVREGDIVYSRRGDVTRKALITRAESGMFCGTGCLLVRPGGNIHSRFLTYHLSTPENQEWIIRHAIGATMPNLNTGILAGVPLNVPSLATQEAIASILGALDDKIELNRQMNTTLEAMAQALFKSWFVAFDPVIDNALAVGNPVPDELAEHAEGRAKIAQLKSSAQPPTLPASIRQRFPDRFVFTEAMGWVPEGWEAVSLDDIVDLIGGGTPKTTIEEYWGGDIPWFSVVDAPVNSDVFVIRTEKNITRLGLENSSTKLLPEGTTIISARGTVGKCALAGQAMAMNQSCYGVRGKSGIADYFVYYTIVLRVSDLQQRGHGSVFNTITRDTFKSILTPRCPVSLTATFHAQVSESFSRIRANNQQIGCLTQLRDTLLPKLLSGQLRIPEAEDVLAEAL